MSSRGATVFEVLSDDPPGAAGTTNQSGTESADKDNSKVPTDPSNQTSDDAGAWQVSSTKRRLAPSFTLSRQDLGADSPRNKAANQELAAAKKKGQELYMKYIEESLIIGQRITESPSFHSITSKQWCGVRARRF
jgi:hypothetical protein